MMEAVNCDLLGQNAFNISVSAPLFSSIRTYIPDAFAEAFTPPTNGSVSTEQRKYAVAGQSFNSIDATGEINFKS